MPWLLNEDTAVKAKLSGISVTTSTGSRTVPVVFQYPEVEAGDAEYPMIVIDRVSATRASYREHQGFTQVRYKIEGKPTPGPEDLWGYYGEFPIPYDLDYQVTALARFRSHLTEICGLLSMGDRLPARGGYVEIPGIEVVASMDLLSGPDQTALVDSDGKRLYSANWMIRVYSEVFPWDVQRYDAVLHVVGRVRDREDKRNLTTFDEN